MPPPPSRPAVRVAVVAALAVAGLAFGAVPTGAQDPGECLVVTEDTVLDHDVGRCNLLGAGAIEIGAPNITLDLNGHTVEGNIGVRNPGHDGVTLKNGIAVGDNQSSVSIEHADRNTVRDVHTETNISYGIRLIDSDRAHITGNLANAYRGGIALHQGSDRNLVRGNRVHGHTGINVEDSSRNLIVANSVRTGETTLAVLSGTANAVVFNAFRSSSVGATIYAPALRTFLLGNSFCCAGDTDGLQVESRSTVLIANSANDNARYGIRSVPGVFAVANRASGNGQPAQCLNVRCR